jgi:putative lipoprotein
VSPRLLIASLVMAGTAALAAGFPHGVAFKAESLAGKPFDPVALPTLKVASDGKAGGSTGCNRYFGAVAVSGEAMKVSGFGMTRMACFDGAGDNERRFTAALGSATAWRMDGTRLVLETAQGPMVLARQ